MGKPTYEYEHPSNPELLPLSGKRLAEMVEAGGAGSRAAKHEIQRRRRNRAAKREVLKAARS